MAEHTSKIAVPFARGKVLMWILIIVLVFAILIREGNSMDVEGIITFGIGAAVFIYLAQKGAGYFLRSKIKDPIGMLFWSIGIFAYLVFFLLVWLALGF